MIHGTRLRTVFGALAAAAAVAAATGCGGGGAEGATGGADGTMVLATTTSTQNSGLLDELVPMFEKSGDCVVKPVAVGSGQAMAMGEKGEADALLVHSPEDEERFMADGHGSSREAVMHNDFVIVGPPDDPAGLGGEDDAAAALKKIARSKTPFASRADDSGTHAKELTLWEQAGVDPGGSWYVETGQGMGETLTVANQKEAYTLADRGTYLATGNLASEIAFEGTKALYNEYHVIVAEKAANTGCAEEFAAWIRGADVQQDIAEFGVEEHGEPLFFPDAKN
ncbi:tungstate transport system substrate-binding protein [Murinocardiopsis flavida]|uniref:Tungstate transport system substrate-binding protein n=1 Tax=Murinocardiopsis flavida TaxID=645275 RepID=A0A2P8DKK7_9ACTN|nr:substrate-binding domain-containing protein [Murinocardiopsis flavida]PSK97729.1 tungstate transport system substrate-binding protein [Murinocardiopsis flavida]